MIFDNNYFNDKYQGIPVGGYNKLVKGLLDGVECLSNVDFFAENIKISGLKTPLKLCWNEFAEKLVYTGAIDEYFDYKLGKLAYSIF